MQAQPVANACQAPGPCYCSGLGKVCDRCGDDEHCSRCGATLGTAGPLCDVCLGGMQAQHVRKLAAQSASRIAAQIADARRVIEDAVLAEQERCAKIVEDSRHGHWYDPPAECILIAAKIREEK